MSKDVPIPEEFQGDSPARMLARGAFLRGVKAGQESQSITTLHTYCFDGQPHQFDVLAPITRTWPEYPPVDCKLPSVTYVIGDTFYCRKCLMKVDVLKQT